MDKNGPWIVILVLITVLVLENIGFFFYLKSNDSFYKGAFHAQSIIMGQGSDILKVKTEREIKMIVNQQVDKRMKK